MISEALESVHQIAGQAQGEIALGLAAKRGVTRSRIVEWAAMYRQASEELLVLLGSLPAPTPKEEDNDSPTD